MAIERKIKMENKQENLFEVTKEETKADEKTKDKQKKVDKETPKKKEEKKFKAPFGFAFGPQRLDVVPGAVNGEEYTLKQIKNLIIKIGINELKAPDASLHYIKDENIFVLTNILQKKGASTLSAASISKIEARFLSTYIVNETEDRALVYKNKHTGQERLFFPDNLKTMVSLEGAPEMFLGDNLDWPLHADLHSHHILGGIPSKTDDENEQVRGIIYGIAHWQHIDTMISWNFRMWNGNGYEQLDRFEVISYGSK